VLTVVEELDITGVIMVLVVDVNGAEVVETGKE